MTTYADLLYEAAEVVHELSRQLDGEGLHSAADEMEELSEKIHEALRTRSAHPALSTEDVERIKSNYPHPPKIGVAQDVYALANSHEAMRRERDTANSIAERFDAGWTPVYDSDADERQWWNTKIGTGAEDQTMTADQIAWFEARA